MENNLDLVQIRAAIHESITLTMKMNAETMKIHAATMKINADTEKIRREGRYMPFVAAALFVGSVFVVVKLMQHSCG